MHLGSGAAERADCRSWLKGNQHTHTHTLSQNNLNNPSTLMSARDYWIGKRPGLAPSLYCTAHCPQTKPCHSGTKEACWHCHGLAWHTEIAERGSVWGRPEQGGGNFTEARRVLVKTMCFTVQFRNNSRGVLFTKNWLNVTTERMKTLCRGSGDSWCTPRTLGIELRCLRSVRLMHGFLHCFCNYSDLVTVWLEINCDLWYFSAMVEIVVL